MFYQFLSTIKVNLVAKIILSVYLSYLSCKAQKNTIYRGLNLISKKSKMAAKMTTIVGDVTGPQHAKIEPYIN